MQAHITIEGVAPLIQRNIRLADPLDSITREITKVSKKRNKTEDDLREIARLEWFGGLYSDPALEVDQLSGRVVLPSTNLERVIRDGAAKSKEGKTVQAAVIVLEDAVLDYKGPKDTHELWLAGRNAYRESVKVGQVRVLRTRPIFREWKCSFVADFHDDLVDPDRLRHFLDVAGRQVGVGDWRPKHGRFIVTSFEVSR